MDTERRRFKRLPTALIARLRTRKPTQGELLQIQISNVSTGGVFISTLQPFPIGTVVEFDFHLPGATDAVHATGVVRWILHHPPDIGMGVEFLEVTTASRVSLDTFIRRKMDDEQKLLPPGT